MSINLNHFIPFLFRPVAIFSHIWRTFVPVPVLDWFTPIYTIVCLYVGESRIGYPDLQTQKLSPAERKLRENISEIYQHDFPKFFRQVRIEINIVHPEQNALKQQSDQCLQFDHVPFQGDYSNILSFQK